jgi:hypothetical protein
MRFKDSEGYKKAVDFFGSHYVLAEKAKFSCYCDHIFSYSFKRESEIFTIDFISDDILLPEMSLLDLLNLSRIEYLHYHYRLLDELKVSEEAFNLSRTAEDN